MRTINRFHPDKPIKRTSQNSFNDYRMFEKDLRSDFNDRCGYCGTSKQIIRDFEIDHFVPKKAFSGINDTLENDYNNLVWCCKKCNRTKASKFLNELVPPKLKNALFYDPCENDLNTIFYRNDYGFIKAKTQKGKEIITRLRLYDPFYSVAWLIEQIKKLLNALLEQSKIVANKSEINTIIAELTDKLLSLEDLLNSAL